MLDDLTKTVKAQLYERASSPLFSSFGLSWVVWNYKFLIILFSTMPAAEKITYIDTHLFTSVQDIALRGAIFPLISAVAFILLYPIPAKHVYEYWRNRQKELKAIQQRIDDETPLTQEEARQLRRQSLLAEQEHEKEIAQRSTEITRLREIIAELESKHPDTDIVLTVKTDDEKKIDSSNLEIVTAHEIDNTQVKLLESIGQHQYGVYQAAILAPSDDRIEMQYNLDELIKHGYIETNYDENHDLRFIITPYGRAYIVKRRREQNAKKMAA